MSNYATLEYDVLVIGAGGAGLRAAIEASAAGARVGLICKSLLGKAHTVMAEGGMAAALANVDDRDNWKVHFADTMRGGQYVNNWRMAELHAQEAPERVRELEAWGAVFDRTADGKILQRNFGGHRYPRLAHVGDRTGLELIRTLQEANGFQPEDVESAIFTSSPDLTAEYPARAARRLGWDSVPLLGASEVAVPDGLPRCIRLLLHLYTTKPPGELKHMYLRGAAKLRPDRTT